MTIFNQQNVTKWLHEQAISHRLNARLGTKVAIIAANNTKAEAYEFAIKTINEMETLPRQNVCPNCKEEIL